jgi:hypothetical protein
LVYAALLPFPSSAGALKIRDKERDKGASKVKRSLLFGAATSVIMGALTGLTLPRTSGILVAILSLVAGGFLIWAATRAAPSGKPWWVNTASWLAGYLVTGLFVAVPVQYFIGYPHMLEPRATGKDRPLRATEQQEHAEVILRSCLLTAARKLDDNTSEATTIAVGMKPLCAVEFNRWRDVWVQELRSPADQEIFRRDDDASFLRLATSFVLTVRAERRKFQE